MQGYNEEAIEKVITRTLSSAQKLIDDVNQNGKLGRELNATVTNVRELTARLNDLVANLQPSMVEGKPLIIGGATIPHNKGLLGHSDGDIVLHAVCDAALGAIAAGEIGLYFPPTDLTIMGISSRVIAEKTIAILKEKGAAVIRMSFVW